MKSIGKIILIGFISGIVGALFVNKLFQKEVDYKPVANAVSNSDTHLIESVENMPVRGMPDMTKDFVSASRSSTQSVVYIKNMSEQRYAVSWMDMLFGESPGSGVRVSSGSGVIFSSDGYIVSNNHVVKDADNIEVIVNKQTYQAELIGVDPSTDLAVLKIDESNLPEIPLGSSKNLQVGEWVIAVGNPFNLTSTVTAGIVSAKGRQLNIVKEKFPIESFIQTDAAINPGNSGGALVNTEGMLVGINTAILSKTGSYTGYGFAVPVDIVRKVFNDIVKYGEVQKAFFGGEVEDFNSEIAKRLDIGATDDYSGVLLVYIQDGGASSDAGLKEGDLIMSIDGIEINSRGNFEEELSYRSPGDEVMVTYQRNGKEYNTKLSLTNIQGTTGILKRVTYSSEVLGAEFEEVPKVELDLLGISSGIRVFNIKRVDRGLYGISEGFIITTINKTPMKSAEKLIDILENIEGYVWIEGVDKNGKRARYRF